MKTFKTDEHLSGLLTFGNLTQQLQIDTNEILNQSSPDRLNSNLKKKRQANITPNAGSFGQIELNILTYYGYKEDIYETLTMMSRKSLYFMKKNHKKIEQSINLKHANEKIRLIQVKSLEEHSSGVNQLLKINQKELVTVSDDCYLKFWSAQTLKVDGSLSTETITCIAQTGHKTKDILVAGCHSGNLILISASQRLKKDQVSQAHYNLIRVIVSLEALKHKYFVTADVCGVVKVWTSNFKPQQVLELDLVQAISYNSMIEVLDMLPRRSTYDETAMIACALKSQKINLILLLPASGTYQIIKTFKTSLKPTCLIQLSSKHLAIAVGSLKENSEIEIHDMNKEPSLVSCLKHHNDMIDSLLKIELPQSKTKTKNPYVTWLLSASRDRQIVLWKLVDGKIMRRNYDSLIQSMKKQSGIQPTNSNRMSVDEFKKQKLSQKKKKDQKQRKPRKNSDGEDEELSERDEDDEAEEESEEEKESSGLQSPSRLDQKASTLSKDISERSPQNGRILDYYYVLDSGHKDFIRSMVQLNDNTLITASEDKTIKIFTIAF